MSNQLHYSLVLSVVMLASCSGGGQKQALKERAVSKFTGAKGEVRLITLDPGHFHAALVQKNMYEQVNPTVYVYAPEGSDVQGYLKFIDGFNNRPANPTSWDEKVYTGKDFLDRMLTERPGNVVMLSGNNSKKTEYIKASIEEGLNVLADKPMAINTGDFALLEKAFRSAEEQELLLYDIMTERFEITTIIQRELSKIPEVFGVLKEGTPEEPSITKESVHHFYKEVDGRPLIRPAWFYDTEQQGEGIVDVSTHLVDLIQWEAFPEQPLGKEDVEMIAAKRWPTVLTPGQFEMSTGLPEFPGFLKKDIEDGKLNVYANGEMVYKLKGKHAKVSVAWNFDAPKGAGDMHYSIMRGSLCDLIIQQSEKEQYKPTVYIKATIDEGLETFEGGLQKAVNQDIATMYPGLKLVKLEDKLWTVDIPDKYKVGHEAHFGQVVERYLRYLVRGKLPEWEVPNMITKYYTTTQALEMANK